jgi:hypothetical protein
MLRWVASSSHAATPVVTLVSSDWTCCDREAVSGMRPVVEMLHKPVRRLAELSGGNGSPPTPQPPHARSDLSSCYAETGTRPG